MDKIVLEHVNYTYGEGTPFVHEALKDVSARIEADRITGVIGHTGSGKSTMMMLLNGLIQPTSGKVYLDGFDIHSGEKDLFREWIQLPENQNKRKSTVKKAVKAKIESFRKSLCFRVGLVMQYPEYQLFEETVFKDVAYGPKNMGLSDEEIKERVTEAVHFCGLEENLLDKSPFDLSGGQKRRAAIAGVIAMKPEVLVLDEPAAGLDPIGREQIFCRIRDYQKATHSTVIIVSHSMEDMAEFCDDMIVMSRSQVICQGNKNQVFSQVSMLENAGLDIPQITQLMKLLRERGLNVPEDIYTVEQAHEALKSLFSI